MADIWNPVWEQANRLSRGISDGIAATRKACNDQQEDETGYEQHHWIGSYKARCGIEDAISILAWTRDHVGGELKWCAIVKAAQSVSGKDT